MASAKEIVIKIEGDGTSPIKKISKEESLTGNDKSPTDKAISGKSVFLTYAANKGLAVVKQAVETSANRYITLKEDYLAENTLSVAKAIISKSTSFGAAIGGGFSVGGPIGAGVALTAYIGSEAVNIANHYSQVYQSINQNNYNMNFQRVRMGLVDGGRGTEN